MALIKCKECGQEISKQAKECPKCGSPQKKGRDAISSLARWFIIIFVILPIGFAIFSINYKSDDASSNKKPKNTTGTPSGLSTVSNPKKSPWSVAISKDEMTGKAEAYAVSVSVPAKPRMKFPYSDVTAWLGVGCNDSSEWAYIGFNGGVNLSDTETGSGYNTFTTRVKWNEEIVNTKFTQKWSAEVIHFQNDVGAVNRIMGSKTALIEMRWHGQESTYFQFSLDGSSAAIKKMREKCR